MPKLWWAEPKRRFTVEKCDKGACVCVSSLCLAHAFEAFLVDHTFHNFLLIPHCQIAGSKGEGAVCPQTFLCVCSALRGVRSTLAAQGSRDKIMKTAGEVRRSVNSRSCNRLYYSGICHCPSFVILANYCHCLYFSPFSMYQNDFS